jgi:hypothetical protein
MGIFSKLNVEKKVQSSEKSNHSDFNGDINFLELKEGKNRVRILPPTKDYPDYEFHAARHYNVGLDGKQSVLCPKRTFPNSNYKCPICEANQSLYKSKDKDDRELAKQLYATERNFANVLNLDEEAEPKNVYVLSYGYTIANLIVKKISDPDYGDITDLETGFNINIEKDKNRGGQPTYQVEVKKQCAAPEFDVEQVVKLNEIYKTIMPYEGLKMVLEGESVETAIKEYGLIDVATGEAIETKKKNNDDYDEPDTSTEDNIKPKKHVEEEKSKSRKNIDPDDEDTNDEDSGDEPAIEKQFKKPESKKPAVDDDDIPKSKKKIEADEDEDDIDIMAQLKARKAKMQAK